MNPIEVRKTEHHRSEERKEKHDEEHRDQQSPHLEHGFNRKAVDLRSQHEKAAMDRANEAVARQAEETKDLLGHMMQDFDAQNEIDTHGLGEANGNGIGESELRKGLDKEIGEQPITETEADEHLEDDLGGDEQGIDQPILKAPTNVHWEKQRQQRIDNIISKYQLVDPVVDHGGLLQKEALFISPEKMMDLLDHPKDMEDVGILDLRNDVKDDEYDRHIRGATDYKVAEPGKEGANQEENEKLRKRFYELGSPMDILFEKYKTNWKTAFEEEHLPFPALAEKPILIIHCFHSKNRTPSLSRTYIKYVAPNTQQKVIILKGGFSKFSEIARGKGRLDLIPERT